ncbi:hypothetical protein LVB77_14670 [Lysobacter sp. 5GHs7-4]|uniref:hypothetical protein n=1 Tax=Lysobacter sp. 5GHs7-4 TaxID=2904253 RepID=UPI001E5FF2FF|nr:hypothetical protein [Lysobacter sp. 5GHs7-4]UHQ21909.1 hypothetical protein LVB77_14670 [Lysobacter sp. 5GHs7-4]
MNEKKRPIEERVAAMLGRSAYADLREGTGGTCPLQIRDQDIAAALGWVSQKVGKLAPLALETYYGSTLVHQNTLMRAWEEKEGGQTREQLSLTRLSGALAVRELAGAKHCTTAYAEYAYLIVSRREVLQQRVRAAGAWLEDLKSTGLRELRAKLRDIWEEQAKERAKELAKRAAA